MLGNFAVCHCQQTFVCIVNNLFCCRATPVPVCINNEMQRDKFCITALIKPSRWATSCVLLCTAMAINRPATVAVCLCSPLFCVKNSKYMIKPHDWQKYDSKIDLKSKTKTRLEKRLKFYKINPFLPPKEFLCKNLNSPLFIFSRLTNKTVIALKNRLI